MYRIKISNSSKQYLKKVNNNTLAKLTKSIDDLKLEPMPINSKKLKGKFGEFYRIRVGDYRVIYTIIEKEKVIIIEKIGSRKDIYKK
jgi:mRNA interferase RelE/StbE